MAKIAILNDYPEVVALLAHFLTPGHAFLNRIGASERMLESVVDFAPDLLLVPIHRRVASIDRPIQSEDDLLGLAVLRLITGAPALAAVPVVLVSFYVREHDLPEDVRAARRYGHFLAFPLGLQELNPLISGLVGPALGTPDDVRRVRGF